MSKRHLGAARSPNGFNIFKDHETNWVFKRTLEAMSEKAAETGECLYAASQIDETDGNSWIEAWAALGDRVLANGIHSLENGHPVSARECFLRACNYYRTAEYGCPPSHPRFYELWSKSVAAFQKACPLFDPPIQVLQIPFRDKLLPGYFWTPDNSGTKRPTMVAVGGNDSSGEEIFLDTGFGANRRGFNFFTFEYPGHRGTVHLYPDCIKQPDYEVPFKAVFDYLETLEGVDERIALSGFSFGGYVVSRVACFEKRIKALIPDSPIVDVPILVLNGFLGSLIKGVPDEMIDKIIARKLRKSPLTKALFDYSAWTWGAKSLSEELHLDSFKKHTLNEYIRAITCPVLGLVGENEGEMMLKQAQFFYKHVSSEKKNLYIFKRKEDGSDDHCQLDNFARGQQVVYDWLDTVFKK